MICVCVAGFNWSYNLNFIFAQGGDLEAIGGVLTEEEAFIMEARYLASEYGTFPWDWDIDYPSENQWCPEDINTILQCDIALNKHEKLKQHPNVNKN